MQEALRIVIEVLKQGYYVGWRWFKIYVDKTRQHTWSHVWLLIWPWVNEIEFLHHLKTVLTSLSQFALGPTWINLSQCIWIRLLLKFSGIFLHFQKHSKLGGWPRGFKSAGKHWAMAWVFLWVSPLTCTHHFLDISLVPFMATKKSTFWWRRARVQCYQVIKWERGFQGFSMLLKPDRCFWGSDKKKVTFQHIHVSC